MIDSKHNWNSALKPLFIGFIFSIIFVLSAYLIAEQHLLKGLQLHIALFVAALVQAAIQLIFFMHLLIESKPRWNLLIFLFTVLVMVIVVAGSLWIMYHINYNNMLMPGE